MECISTTSFSILINWIPGDPFRPGQGIRQGDPISPYIFIICAEYLGRYLFFKSNIPKSGIGIKVARKRLSIPCLMFADDVLIFCKASKAAARNIRDILQDYCKVSRQLVNFHKSTVQFSKGVQQGMKDDITDILQIPSSHSLRNYLGCPNIDKKTD